MVQHNIVWNAIFSSETGPAFAAIRSKVRRLIYDEIKEMDAFPNFNGARALGYCLHVLGLTKGDRKQNFRREDYALRVVAIDWARKNYRRLLRDHPMVAAACLQGSVIYDESGQRLVKTFADMTRKAPPSEFLVID